MEAAPIRADVCRERLSWSGRILSFWHTVNLVSAPSICVVPGSPWVPTLAVAGFGIVAEGFSAFFDILIDILFGVDIFVQFNSSFFVKEKLVTGPFFGIKPQKIRIISRTFPSVRAVRGAQRSAGSALSVATACDVRGDSV